MSAPKAGTPDAIMAEISETRTAIAGTLAALEERLSPAGIWNEVSSSLSPVRQASNDFTRSLGASVRDNPLPTALIGLGVCWLAVAGGRNDPLRTRPGKGLMQTGGEARRRLDSRRFYQMGDLEKMGEYAEAKDTVRETGERLSEEARRAGETGEELSDEARRAADEAAGEAGERISEGARRARETGEELTDEARRTARETGKRISEGARRAREKGEEMADEARRAARETGDRISEGARRAARDTRERADRWAAVAREKSSEAYHRTSEAGARVTALARNAASDGTEFARMHPIGVALGVLGVGAIVAAVMIARSERRRDDIERTGTAAKDYVRDTAERAAGAARGGVGRARRSAKHLAERFRDEEDDASEYDVIEADDRVRQASQGLHEERASFADGPLASDRPEEPSKAAG